jgi:hypothetical protein
MIAMQKKLSKIMSFILPFLKILQADKYGSEKKQ